MSKAVQIIRLEHFNVGSVLSCLRYVVNEIDKGRWEPDFRLLAAILDYLESFPEVFHHPKEEDYLFKALRRRRPEIALVLDQLRDQHVQGVTLLERLGAALARYRQDRAAFPTFRAEVEGYLAFQREHMRREEREVLPAALEALTPEDWSEIDAAFGSNQDPLFGAARRKEFDLLFSRIVELAPVPMGFAERAERKAGGGREP